MVLFVWGRYKPAIGNPTDTSNFDPTFTRKKFHESESLPTVEDVQGKTANAFESFTFVDPKSHSMEERDDDGLDD
jgi:hypothetical protein